VSIVGVFTLMTPLSSLERRLLTLALSYLSTDGVVAQVCLAMHFRALKVLF